MSMLIRIPATRWIVALMGLLPVGSGTVAADEPFAWQAATPESLGMSGERLEALRAALAEDQTHGLLVVRHDRIACEWYAPGFSATRPHYGASMSKALVGGVATAVAIGDGRIALDDRAAEFVPSWRDDPRKSRITIRMLGSHTSGLEDAEEGETPHVELSGWKGAFWKAGPPPDDPFTLARDRAPIMFEPGTRDAYSNPGIAMLVTCVTVSLREAPERDLRTLLRDRVLRPIGVGDDEWSVGYGKTFEVGGLPLVAAWGGGSFTARAAARVGRLMLRGGDWDGYRPIAAEAVRQVTTDVGTPGPGAIGWWSNNEGVCPEVPADAFWGLGAGHQVIVVIPSLDLIAVRNGNVLQRENDWDQAFYREILIPLVRAVE